MGLASYLLLILLLICGSALARGDLKQLTENKAFVERFSDGTFEIVQPKLEESTIRLTPTLVLQVEKNNFTFSDFEDDENCFYQGRIKGVEDSLVALSSCYGLRGILIYPNGTSFGIWPLNRTPNGKSGSHILYSDLLHPSLLNKEDSVRKVQKFRGKFVKIDLELDDISDFANDTSKAEFYFRDATNVADMISSRHMNIRLSAVVASKAAADVPRADLKVALTTAKSLKTHDRSSFAGKLCDVSDREAQIRAEDAPFTTHATASALAIAVGEAVGVPLNIECERRIRSASLVVENRRCLHDYPPPQPSSPVTPREFAEIVDTAINVSKKNVVEKRSYQVGSGTIVAIICSAGVLLMILLIVLQLTYRRMAPRDLKPVKEVKIEAPRKRVITFGAMPSYKSEKSRISKTEKSSRRSRRRN